MAYERQTRDDSVVVKSQDRPDASLVPFEDCIAFPFPYPPDPCRTIPAAADDPLPITMAIQSTNVVAMTEQQSFSIVFW